MGTFFGFKTSQPLRRSERATQFIGTFQTAPHLKARKASLPIFPISIVNVEIFPNVASQFDARFRIVEQRVFYFPRETPHGGPATRRKVHFQGGVQY